MKGVASEREKPYLSVMASGFLKAGLYVDPE
jgi:hypothetical protein